MKKFTDVTKMSLTFDDLMNLNLVHSNRCGALTCDDALSKGYMASDFASLKARAKKLMNSIKRNGFSKSSTFIVAVEKDTEDFFLLDGQGRRMALYLLGNDDKDDEETLRIKEEILHKDYMCDFYEKPMTQSEMAKIMIDINSGNTNWTNKDKRRCEAMSSTKEGVLEAYNEVEKYKEENNLSGDYMANFLFFGDKASHGRSDGINELTKADYAPHKEYFCSLYSSFLKRTDKARNYNGEMVLRSKDLQKKIRTTNLGIAICCSFRKIVSGFCGDYEKAMPTLEKFVDALVAYCKGDDKYICDSIKADIRSAEKLTNLIRIKKYPTLKPFFAEA